MLVSLIVLELVVVAHVAGGGREVAGHHVPADATLGQVVERRHPPRERIRVLVRGTGRHAESEILGDGRHGRDQQNRIADGNLRAVADGGFVRTAVDVVGAEDVGDEDPVEGSAFEQLSQVGPVAQVLVIRGTVVGVAPHARRLVGDAVHVEGIETDLSSHRAIVGHARCLRQCWQHTTSHGYAVRHVVTHYVTGAVPR